MKNFKLIKDGYNLREKLEIELLNQLNETLNLEEKVQFYNLAHLIAHGYVDIKIGFVKDGLFHSKFGICSDAEHNIIYFSGSNNETQAAIEHNYEAFDVTTTWLSSL